MTHLKCLAVTALALTLSAPAAIAQQKTVTLMAYSGIFQERYTKAVVEPFMKANPDIKVEFFGMPNSAQMLGTLRAQKAAPQADVVIMDVSVSKAGTDEGFSRRSMRRMCPRWPSFTPRRVFRTSPAWL